MDRYLHEKMNGVKRLGNCGRGMREKGWKEEEKKEEKEISSISSKQRHDWGSSGLGNLQDDKPFRVRMLSLKEMLVFDLFKA